MHTVNLIREEGQETSLNNNEVKVGKVTSRLQSNLEGINEEGKQIILSEAISILSCCADPNSDTNHQDTGLVIGYVQSGKTLSFTTLIGLSADNDYRAVIVLAGTKNNLLEQTTNRLIDDLETSDFNSLNIKLTSEPEKQQLRRWFRMSSKPLLVIPILKHQKYLNDIADLFSSPEIRDVLGNGAVLIIDDEADQASLNTFARKNSKKEDWEDSDYSSTYLSILNLKNNLPNHTYLQYTATPQAPLLISITDMLSPSFHVVLTPGKGYTGGKEFFINRSNTSVVKIPQREVYNKTENPLTECPDSLRKATQEFLIGAVIHLHIRRKKGPFTMMVHPDREKNDCDLFYTWIKYFINRWSDILDPFNNDLERPALIAEFKKVFEGYNKNLDDEITFDDIEELIFDLLLDTGCSLVIGKDQTKFPEAIQKIKWSEHPAHIIVGADMLNRGFTVEGLAVTYMPRYSKSITMADTMQQRARFFGYKGSYADLCRIYLPIDSINEYTDYVEDEETLRGYLKDHTLAELSQLILQSDKMKPTRGNILSKSLIKTKMTGARGLVGLDFQGMLDNNKLIDQLLAKYDFKLFHDYKTPLRNHGFVNIDIQDALTFLHSYRVLKPSEVMRKQATLQYLRFLRESGINKINLFKMDMEVEAGKERKRGMVEKDGFLNSKNIFSGRSTKGEETYPGDREILFNDSLNIQIYTIRIESTDHKEYNDRLFKTIGLVYPEGLEKTFVGID